MPQKKKEPRLRWKLTEQPSLKNLWSPDCKLQEWSETQNKYIDIPVVE